MKEKYMYDVTVTNYYPDKIETEMEKLKKEIEKHNASVEKQNILIQKIITLIHIVIAVVGVIWLYFISSEMLKVFFNASFFTSLNSRLHNLSAIGTVAVFMMMFVLPFVLFFVKNWLECDYILRFREFENELSPAMYFHRTIKDNTLLGIVFKGNIVDFVFEEKDHTVSEGWLYGFKQITKRNINGFEINVGNGVIYIPTAVS